jgi:hypothetical protein
MQLTYLQAIGRKYQTCLHRNFSSKAEKVDPFLALINGPLDAYAFISGHKRNIDKKPHEITKHKTTRNRREKQQD